MDSLWTLDDNLRALYNDINESLDNKFAQLEAQSRDKSRDCKGPLNEDTVRVNKFFNDSDLNHRYGKKFKAGYTGLLQIKFPSAEHLHWIFQNKNSLGDGQLKIRCDLTKQQIEYRYNIFDELHKR